MEDQFKENLSTDTKLQAQVLDILKSTDIGKEYAKTIAQNYFEENISSEHKKIYDYLDTALQDAGLEKPAGVKTSEWAKMIATQNKELNEKVNTLKSNSNPSDTLKNLEAIKAKHIKEKTELTNAAQSQIDEREQIINSLKDKEKSFLRNSEMQKVVSTMDFNKGLDQSLINDIITLKTQVLISNSIEEDGKVIWNKPDGSAYKDGIMNASLEFVLQQELQTILHNNAAGGGAGNAPTNNGDYNGSQVIVSESTFRTQEQFLIEFDKIAQRKGIPKGENYDNLYWEAFERYNIKTLKEY
tara:strand:- start:8331 stop:9227 length:897 start_codon:yes stop_codon:yes gene_type:complete